MMSIKTAATINVIRQEGHRTIAEQNGKEIWIDETAVAGKKRRRQPSNLEVWKNNNQITTGEYVAGCMLQEEYEQAFGPDHYAVGDYGERVDGSKEEKDRPISRIDAHQRYMATINAIPERSRQIIQTFVCQGLPVSRTVADKDRNAAGERIKCGLSFLVSYYEKR